ncbi:MAG: TIGR02452 family protein [Jaaginema sp. PMC 1079.18]|nr:TIGR02452 family protein [Jaaginema sp. PMC 1080.18]MEC4851945.1 TIGR02452 family protein [Jaaginema sp. PMC 1079.18]MEC4866457.1 TIGR02452 family protein [Jaaginema sp. PMC 1078.18]
MSKLKRKGIAQDTVNILKDGCYQTTAGKMVTISPNLSSCLTRTRCYTPEGLVRLEAEVLSQSPVFSQTNFGVENETSLQGAERLARLERFRKIGVLNFASAKNPGGGFLKGSQAQEESLARSSGLYSSLLKCPEYYEFHRSTRSLLYSNHIIYSPGCPVFRLDDGTLLDEPYCVDFITSPAPNLGAIERNEPKAKKEVPGVLRDRASKILTLAAYHNCDALVLGAWGCGVFRNNPAVVAQVFADLLLPSSVFWGRFDMVLFSVLDRSSELNIFNCFANNL